MSVAEALYIGIERRINNLDAIDLWDLLTKEQQFSACSLGQFGYHLSFVRSIGDCYLAILHAGDKVATINCHGEINTSPDIKLRA